MADGSMGAYAKTVGSTVCITHRIISAEQFANRLAENAAAILVSIGKPAWGGEAMAAVRRCGLEVLGIARGERCAIKRKRRRLASSGYQAVD